MTYATVADVQAGFRPLDEAESGRCEALLDEAGIIIDACNAAADPARKKLVACRMVRRQLDSQGASLPMGASQGSASALGYAQTWTMAGGSAGERYLSKLEKRLLGAGNRIGAHSPVEDLCCTESP